MHAGGPHCRFHYEQGFNTIALLPLLYMPRSLLIDTYTQSPSILLASTMDIKTVLKVPRDEFQFIHPMDEPSDGFDRRFARLRVERRGLRKWTSFEENPISLQDLLKVPTSLPTDWRPYIDPWDRVLASELSMVDLFKKTIGQRLKISLNTISPGTSIVGTPKHFNSYGNDDNRPEGSLEVRIGPDFVVLDDDASWAEWSPELRMLEHMAIAIGDAKVKRFVGSEDKILPGTVSCYESWLAQAVQCCIDLDIPLGFVVTNVEIVFFHVLKVEEEEGSWKNQTRTTRSTTTGAGRVTALPSDVPSEADYSSPMVRKTQDWIDFAMGDSDIPFVSKADQIHETPAQSTPRSPLRVPLQLTSPTKSHSVWQPQLQSSPLLRKQRQDTPEAPPSMPSMQSPTTSTPESRTIPTVASSSFSRYGFSTPALQRSQRQEDMTYILIKPYLFEDGETGQRLFEFIMLAKRAKEHGLLCIGPHKLSHSALDQLSKL